MFQSNESKRTYSYLLIIFTIIMFGIAIYLLMTQGSSHGIVWGGRYGNKLEGTLNGYGVLLIACGMLLCTLCWLWQNRPKVFPFQWRNKKCSKSAMPQQNKQRKFFHPNIIRQKICMFITNKANKHTLQIIRTNIRIFQIFLFDKNRQVFHLIGPHKNTEISLEQVCKITDDYFCSFQPTERRKVHMGDKFINTISKSEIFYMTALKPF